MKECLKDLYNCRTIPFDTLEKNIWNVMSTTMLKYLILLKRHGDCRTLQFNTLWKGIFEGHDCELIISGAIDCHTKFLRLVTCIHQEVLLISGLEGYPRLCYINIRENRKSIDIGQSRDTHHIRQKTQKHGPDQKKVKK